MQVLIDKLVINYEKQGKGHPILLVHGWADSLSTFNDLSRLLSADFEVISLDLPGFGKSSIPYKAWSLDDYARLIKTFEEKLNLKIYGYIGHSNGGAVLINGLGKEILTSQRLVLISSAGIRDQQKFRKVTLKTIAKSGKIMTSVLPKQMKNNIKNKFYDRIGSDLMVAPEMKETFKLITSEDIQKQAAQIKIPTLLVYGSDDKETPMIYGELLASEIQKSRLEVIDNAGHFVHHTHLQKVSELIGDFLK